MPEEYSPSPSVPFEAVINSKALTERKPRPHDANAEARAIHRLAQDTIKSPEAAMDRLVEASIELCNAESGGISLYEPKADGPGIFRWHGLKGRFEAYAGGTTPRDFSPCGVVLDRVQPIVMNYPERYYPYLGQGGLLSIPEVLLVPLLDSDDVAVGTIWVVSHSEDEKFTKSDAEMLERLGAFASLALTFIRALSDKDVLHKQLQLMVREVNHRVSNSLQLAASVLHLQARRETEQAVRSKLEDAAQRVDSIGRIHNRLYRTGEIETVEVGQYVRDLSDEIAGTTRGRGSDRTYQIRVDAPELHLPTDAVTKLGIIISELLTNAFKHAAPAQAEVAVTVALSQPNDDQLLLVVSDDGAGLPADFVLGKSKGMGMTVVDALAKQLGGKLSVQASRPIGASFSIEIPLPKQRNP